MSNIRICYGCMKKLKENETVCGSCGFDYDSYMREKDHRHLNPGELLYGKYRIGKVLGAGGFGISYIGYDEVLQIKIAIKEYFPADIASRNTTEASQYSNTVHASQSQKAFQYGLEKFLSEARILARFNKMSGIVSVTDFFLENGTGYMIMDYLPGQSLKEIVLDKKELMTESEVMNLISPVMDALEMIHKEGLIHRDISPDNMLMDGEGKLTLIDFGAAREVSNMGKSMTIVLKHGYAPLEQYSTTGSQGPWTDIYALCATIYFMITHAVPETATDRAMGDRLLSLEELGMPVSIAFSDMVKKGLSVQGQDRFQSIEEMKAFLASYSTYSTDFGDKTVYADAYSDRTNLERQRNFADIEKTAAATENFYQNRVNDDRGNGGKNNNFYKYAVIILGVICLVCLIAVVAFSLRKNGESASEGTTESPEVATTWQAENEMETMSGTYVTYKSYYLDEVPMYEQPGDEDVYTTIPEAQCVQIIGKVDYEGATWYKVDYCGKQGWIEKGNARYLSEETLYFHISDENKYNIVFVNKTKIKLHTEPNQESSYAAKGIPYGTEFAVKELENGWGKVNYNGEDCWIDMNVVNNYATDYWQVEVCNGSSDSINLRKKSNADSKSLLKLPVGTVLHVEKTKNGWGKVTYGGKSGWVMLHYTTPCLKNGLESSEDLDGY